MKNYKVTGTALIADLIANEDHIYPLEELQKINWPMYVPFLKEENGIYITHIKLDLEDNKVIFEIITSDLLLWAENKLCPNIIAGSIEFSDNENIVKDIEIMSCFLSVKHSQDTHIGKYETIEE